MRTVDEILSAPARSVRLLLIESDPAVAAPLVDILHSPAGLRDFHLVIANNLREAFQSIGKNRPDLIVVEVDPEAEPELTAITKLHEHATGIPLVALLDDAHQRLALAVLHHGAQSYLLKSQIQADTLVPFLLRTLDRHTDDAALHQSEKHFRLMIEHASDVVLVLDECGVIKYAGPSAEQILEIPAAELLAQNALDFLHRDDRRRFLDRFEKAFETSGPIAPVQFRFRRPQGGWLHLEGKGRITQEAEGQKVCILNSYDVSHRVKLEEELKSMALRDHLTGLHNRRSFLTCLEHELKSVQRADRRGITLLFIDLDGFKGINDIHGHKAGDRALIQAAQILKSTFREADLVARLGGDEFVVYLKEGEEDLNLEGLKKRLFDTVLGWNEREGRAYRLAMSVGAIHHDLRKRRSAKDLLRDADALMYKNKREKKQLP